jgi:hypothetical protein
VTHFGRAMYQLNIDTFCANNSPAKGRVERAHLTLQDRLVKELRLRGVSTAAGANAYASAFMSNYNARFAKPPKSGVDAHRPLRVDEYLDLMLTWREPRKVTKSLTVRYDRVTYLLNDTPEHRELIGRYIEVWEYPDERARALDWSESFVWRSRSRHGALYRVWQSGGRCNRCADDPVPIKRRRNKARLFHFFDEFVQRCRCFGTSCLRYAHGLLDNHEPLVEKPQSR